MRKNFARLALAAAMAMGTAVALGSSDAHAPAPAAAAPAAKAPTIPGDVALKMLQDGNARYATETSTRTHQDQNRRCDTFSNGQHPFAAILGCSDSRVPVEEVFDVGVGDVFTIRVAGNVSDVDELGTIEYGVEHLGINLIVVLGHAKCGAVTAVVDHAHVTPNIEKLVDNIVPAAESARKQFPELTGPKLVDKAIRANVLQSIADLSARSELLREKIQSGKVKVAGGVYDLHSGRVDWLDTASQTAATETGPAAESTKPADADQHTTSSPTDSHSASTTTSAAPSHASATTAQASSTSAKGKVPAKKKKEDNWLALGGLLGAAGAACLGTIYFVSGRARSASDQA